MSLKKIDYMMTGFRDGFQSAYGARVLTDDFLPAVEAASKAGVTHFEAGGGARFQSLYFYCNENAFDMMDRFRETAGKEANLQTLSRGINVVGLSSQSRDIIKLHAKLFKKHGMTTIRNFDALNDVQNLIDSGKAIHEMGLKHEICVTVMELPPGCSGAHDAEFYLQTLKEILKNDIPFDSICFKDASGTAVPSKVYETIKGARKIVGDKARIVFHTHETAGISVDQYRSAIEAGADQIDLSMVPVSGGTCQPDIMVMHHALKGSGYTLDIDEKKMYEVEEIFKECMKDYMLPPEAVAVEPICPLAPLPGGALTANTEMLRDNGLLDKYPAILQAMTETVSRGGFGTSVTPVSQFYFQQAFNNVIYGPWEKIAPGYGKMVLGYFGKTPVEPDKELVDICSQKMDLPPTKENPVDLNDANPELGVDAAKKILKENKLEENDENVFIVSTCQEKGVRFLQGKMTPNVRKKTELKEGSADSSGGSSAGKREITTPCTTSSMPGLVLSVKVKVGDKVEKGDEILILEAMKMENSIVADKSGEVSAIFVEEGSQVQPGDPLVGYQDGEGAGSKKAKKREILFEGEYLLAPFSGQLGKWLVKEGEKIEVETPLILLEREGINVTLFSPHQGILKQKVKNGLSVQAGDKLAVIS